MKRRSEGYTLIELALVTALMSAMVMVGMMEKTQEIEVSKAKSVGSQLFDYNNAVRAWLSANVGAANGTYTGTSWLKPTSCGGSSAVQYISCDFPEATEANPIRFGRLSLTSSVVTTGTPPNQITVVSTQTTPFSIDGTKVRADLAGVATLVASAGGLDADKPVMMATEGSYGTDPFTGAITMKASNNTSTDAWLRTDGSNTMNNNLRFNTDSLDAAREIQNVSRIQNIATKTLNIGNAGGAMAATAYKVIVDADQEILGRLVVSNNKTGGNAIVASKGNIEATIGNISAGGSLNAGTTITAKGLISTDTSVNATLDVTAGNSMKAKVFYDADNTSFLLDPSNISVINTLQATGTITSQGRLSTSEYVGLGGIAEKGDYCPQNGLVGRESTGGILSCVNNVWTSPGGRQMYQCPSVHSANGVSSGPWASWGCVGQIWGSPSCLVTVYPQSQRYACTPID